MFEDLLLKRIKKTTCITSMNKIFQVCFLSNTEYLIVSKLDRNYWSIKVFKIQNETFFYSKKKFCLKNDLKI